VAHSINLQVLATPAVSGSVLGHGCGSEPVSSEKGYESTKAIEK
jgi:hypothetical protein